MEQYLTHLEKTTIMTLKKIHRSMLLPRIWKLLCTMDVIVFSIGNVHCNDYHSKSKVYKSSFLRGFVATNNEPMLLVI